MTPEEEFEFCRAIQIDTRPFDIKPDWAYTYPQAIKMYELFSKLLQQRNKELVEKISNPNNYHTTMHDQKGKLFLPLDEIIPLLENK